MVGSILYDAYQYLLEEPELMASWDAPSTGAGRRIRLIAGEFDHYSINVMGPS